MCRMLRRMVQHSSSCKYTRAFAHLRRPLQVRGCAQGARICVARARHVRTCVRARAFPAKRTRVRAHTRAHAFMRTCAEWRRRSVAIVGGRGRRTYAHAGSRTQVTSIGGLHDTATLHALLLAWTSTGHLQNRIILRGAHHREHGSSGSCTIFLHGRTHVPPNAHMRACRAQAHPRKNCARVSRNTHACTLAHMLACEYMRRSAVNTARYGTVRYGNDSMVRYGTVWYRTVPHCMVRCGTARYGTVRFDTNPCAPTSNQDSILKF